jgi:hypothetical protein
MPFFVLPRKIALSQQEEINERTLFFPQGIPLVIAKLAVPQAADGFPFAPRQLEDFLLLIPQFLKTRQFALHRMPLLPEGGFAEPSKLQLGGGGACVQLLRLTGLQVLDAAIDLLDQMTGPRHELVGRPQTQFLLMLHAFAEVQHGFEWKAEWHGVR